MTLTVNAYNDNGFIVDSISHIERGNLTFDYNWQQIILEGIEDYNISSMERSSDNWYTFYVEIDWQYIGDVKHPFATVIKVEPSLPF